MCFQICNSLIMQKLSWERKMYLWHLSFITVKYWMLALKVWSDWYCKKKKIVFLDNTRLNQHFKLSIRQIGLLGFTFVQSKKRVCKEQFLYFSMCVEVLTVLFYTFRFTHTYSTYTDCIYSIYWQVPLKRILDSYKINTFSPCYIYLLYH